LIDSHSRATVVAQTDPKVRNIRRLHVFFGENSDGIFDGISQDRSELANKIKACGT
jgi:hypothetical protein